MSKSSDNKTAAGNTKKTRVKYTAQDMPELSIVLTYLVQALGEATQDAVAAKLEELNCIVRGPTLTKGLEALRAKKILSEGHRDGDRIYRMAQLKWNCSVEVAHVTNITTLVRKLQEAEPGNFEAIQNRMTDGGKKQREPAPKEWKRFKAVIRLLDDWLAGFPYDGTKHDRALYDNSSSSVPRPDPKEPFLVYQRNAAGDVLINKACILGFFKNHLCRAEMAHYKVQYFGCKPIRFKPVNGEMDITRLPIQRDGAKFTNEGSGAGMGWYEVIKEGTELVLEFTAPTKNFMEVDKLRSWLAMCLEMPYRSMAPGRGVQYGTAELVSFEVEG